MRPYAAAALMIAAFGCGKTPAPPAPARSVPAVSLTAPKTDGAAMEARGVDLRLFDSNPTPGAPRKPAFWVHAERFSLTEENVWSFEQARAVIYGREGNAEEVVLEADEGRFQEGKAAYLKGGAVATIGTMKLELNDIEWINDERVARTDGPVSITGTDSNLKASSLRMYPDKKQLVMTNVTGVVRLGETMQ